MRPDQPPAPIQVPPDPRQEVSHLPVVGMARRTAPAVLATVQAAAASLPWPLPHGLAPCAKLGSSVASLGTSVSYLA